MRLLGLLFTGCLALGCGGEEEDCECVGLDVTLSHRFDAGRVDVSYSPDETPARCVVWVYDDVAGTPRDCTDDERARFGPLVFPADRAASWLGQLGAEVGCDQPSSSTRSVRVTSDLAPCRRFALPEALPDEDEGAAFLEYLEGLTP